MGGYEMNQSIEIMKNRITRILLNNKPSIYIYGSIVLDDYKIGWSDIDILCLTESSITSEQAKQLVNLRQELLLEHRGNQYFRSFEGGFLSISAFTKGIPEIVVYWGTSGQRITNKHYFDPFSMMELIDNGYLLFGEDVRDKLNYPSSDDIFNAIANHYDVIRKYAVITERSLYSAGWLLDIARCIYTLRTGKIISKTLAGKWALDNNLVPDVDIMEKIISIREEPIRYKSDIEIMKWTERLGEYIQKYADVLQKEMIATRRTFIVNI
jgi:predicted nucleotidyltransferase